MSKRKIKIITYFYKSDIRQKKSLPDETGKDNNTISSFLKTWYRNPKGQQMIKHKGTSNEVK